MLLFRCGHCKSLAPEYSAAAQVLGDEVPLAKLDATVHEKAAKRFNIAGFPTLKFWKEGEPEPVDYDGDRTSDGKIQFIGPHPILYMLCRDRPVAPRENRPELQTASRGGRLPHCRHI